jgi:single stranded DNA-binding protein
MNQQLLSLMGRATQDAQILTAKSGKDYAKFGVAVNEFRGPEKGESTTFIDVVGFGKQPKAVAKRIRKGDIVIVCGKPEAQAYENKNGELIGKLSVQASYVYNYTVPAYLRKDAEATGEDSEE